MLFRIDLETGCLCSHMLHDLISRRYIIIEFNLRSSIRESLYNLTCKIHTAVIFSNHLEWDGLNKVFVFLCNVLRHISDEKLDRSLTKRSELQPHDTQPDLPVIDQVHHI